ncbi:hypothetical protein [Sphingomonas sp. Leaf23]|uniref:hypothetical protein n=1 Tax=Sphingomonas sp. Leaf23 TaxID=1735689 RepID=UPI0012E0FE55|nr:hypothetical protein [Sphingomonas sp. Leaf23]
MIRYRNHLGVGVGPGVLIGLVKPAHAKRPCWRMGNLRRYGATLVRAENSADLAEAQNTADKPAAIVSVATFGSDRAAIGRGLSAPAVDAKVAQRPFQIGRWMLMRLLKVIRSAAAVAAGMSKPTLVKKRGAHDQRRPLVEITIFRCGFELGPKVDRQFR